MYSIIQYWGLRAVHCRGPSGAASPDSLGGLGRHSFRFAKQLVATVAVVTVCWSYECVLSIEP